MWWSAHTHSHYSTLDGTSRVGDIVAKVAKMGQPAVSLTDHGNMAGTVSLYRAAMQHGVVPFPGVEAYLLDPSASLEDKKPRRYHLGLLALNLHGYQSLISLVSKSHTRPRFSRFPRVTVDDLIELSESAAPDIAVMTGCYFGLAVQSLANDGPGKARNVVEMWANLFPHTFVEIQHHSICHDLDGESAPLDDDDVVRHMVDIAERLGLPVLATQDSHYLDQSERAAHSTMKRLTYGGAEDAFPGDSFHVASAEWIAEHYTPQVWQMAEAGSDHLLNLNTLRIPPLDTFRVHVPRVVNSPQEYIARLCVDALSGYERAQRKSKAYEQRLQYELDVIADLGMANYFALVRNYVEWCEQHHICIEARGSANGSLVCFLLGITQVDPVRWGLMFDRFLSRDRVKPPDIDMDVEDRAREGLMSYLRGTFDTLQIGNWSQLGVNDEGKGSVLVTYRTHLARQVSKGLSAAEQKRQRAMIYGGLTTMADVKRHHPEDYEGLRRLGAMDVYRSYGVHASGLLLSGSDQRISDYVPSMLVGSSNVSVSQFDQDAVEHLGYLKLDVLGQITLTVMRTCQELIGRENPADLTWIPENDSAACKLLREGRTDTGIFHFGSNALAASHNVLTPTRWQPIGTLEVGQTVVSPDGGTATVRGVYPQGPKQLFAVTLSSGAVIEATADHLWNYRLNNGPVVTGTTEQLRTMLDTTTYAPKLVGFEPSDLGTEGEGDHRPVDPYVLGLLLGNGCLTDRHVVRFSTSDKELVDAVCEAYPSLVAKKDTNDKVGWWFRPSKKRGENPLKDGLTALGLMGHAAKDKSIPPSYLWAPIEVRRAVLQGLLDTDGSSSGGAGRSCTVSPHLAEGVQFLVRSLGGYCSLRLSDRGLMKFPLGYTSQSLPLYSLNGIRIPDAFRLKRKADTYNSDIRRKYGRSVVSVEPTMVADAVCISVDSPSECFITDGFVVTHNTKSRGGRDMGIRSTKDAILGTALFMPGAMNSGQTELYLSRRRDREARDRVRYIHPVFEAALKETYGAVVYQEQVINIMRGLGMSIEGVNTFFKIVKSSGAGAVEANNERIAPLRAEFDQLCREAGIADSDIGTAWASTAGFVAYGFSKSHATGYGLRAYRSAYLKAHYPLEYMTALLQAWAGRDKEVLYVREARRMGIRVLPPDVNDSGVSWTLGSNPRRKTIRRGLISIKGVGMAAAESIAQNAPYADIADLIERTDSRAVTGGKAWAKEQTLNGVLGKLQEAGALDSLLGE